MCSVASSNNHNRDLTFLCGGISLHYHQSILSIYSSFLCDMLGALACCKCKKAQCGKKEDVVILLDKIEVGTVQGLMEYIYKGECLVKDRERLKEMQDLVRMLGMNIKLEKNQRVVQNSGWRGCEKIAEGNEPNLEETVQDHFAGGNEDNIADEKREIADDILKFVEIFCTTDEAQKCTKCDEWLRKDNFMDHFKIHKGQILINELSRSSCLGLESEVKVKKSKNSPTESNQKEVPKVTKGKKKQDASKLKNEASEEVKYKKDRKRKIVEVPGEDSYTDEYTCFNPTFKIKPGVKKLAKKSKKESADPPLLVPDIKLTFSLSDLGITEETIKLNELSVLPFVDPLESQSTNKKVASINKPESASCQMKSKDLKTKMTSSLISKDEMKESNSRASSDQLTVPAVLSLPKSNCSFPSFLREVCGQAESLLPPGLDTEHQQLGRRVVHRLLGKIAVMGSGGTVNSDDVMKEMIDGIDDDEDNVNNVSSDVSEAPLVMDLSDQDVV